MDFIGALLLVSLSVNYHVFGLVLREDDDDLTIDLSSFGPRIFGIPDPGVGKNIESWIENGNSSVNPEELGTYAEGDILLPRPLGRNGMKAETYRWKKGVIPFQIKGNFGAKDMDLIEKGITAFHKNTCIRFVPRSSADQDYVTITSDATGCWSSVGRIGGEQTVNLQNPGCVSRVGTVIHELMHAVGFLHEQNREERDNFVVINLNNVQRGTEVNFAKADKGTSSGFGVGYDYGSVMHYSADAFSINGKPTITAKQKTKDVMGQRNGFSSKDIQKIRKMYKCGAKNANAKPNSTSPNEGMIESLIGMIFPTESSQ